MDPGYLRARLEDVRAYDARAAAGSPEAAHAREDRAALLGALAALGLPEDVYVRDPSRPRSALYLYRASGGRNEISAAPWRLARHAPPGMLPRDVRRVGRELRRGLIGCLIGALLALAGALFLHPLAPAAPRDSLSLSAYLGAVPVILGAVCVLCVAAVFWHGLALLFPREALTSDSRARTTLASATASATARADGYEERSATGPHRDGERPRATNAERTTDT